MELKTIFYGLGFTAIMLLSSLAYGLDRSDYRLVWEDDFNGAELDRRYWNVEDNGTGCGNEELQYYIDSPRSVCVRDGNLVLTAVRNDYKGKNFTSGRVNTRGKAAFTYGIVEARMKFPKTTDGLWPAFWMMGNDIEKNSWPLCGEIDILEMGHANGIKSGTQSRLFNGALHWGSAWNDHYQAVGDYTNPYSLQDGKYHTFTFVWTENSMEMFVDGNKKPYLSVDISDRKDPKKPGYYFHKDNFILFNLAVGGHFTGILSGEDVTALPEVGDSAELLIDYVRVYQKK